MLFPGLAEASIPQEITLYSGKKSAMDCSEELLPRYWYRFYTNNFYTTTESLIISTEQI